MARRIIVAMSGGVDSSVAAVKLKKEGFDVIGVTLRLYNQPNSSKSKSCCAGIDIDDAKKVAEQYKFTHEQYLKSTRPIENSLRTIVKRNSEIMGDKLNKEKIDLNTIAKMQ